MRGLKYDDKFLLVLWDKMRYFKSHYVYPSQETFLIWLRNQGGLDVTRRTLNRYLRALENREIIRRIRRIKHHPIRGIQFATTLYSIGIIGLKHLESLGVIKWSEIREYLKNSIPFKARLPKKQKKGISPGNSGYYKNFTSYGEPKKEPG